MLGSELEAALEELRLIRELEPPANSRSRRRERGVYLRRRGDDFVVSKQPGPLGPIGSRRQAALAARALAAATDEELESLLDGGPLPRLRARLAHLAESLRYEEAARLRDRIEALEQIVERLRPARAAARAASVPGRTGGRAGLAQRASSSPAGSSGRSGRSRPGPGALLELEAGLAACRPAERTRRAVDRRAGRGPAAARRLHPPPAARARRAAPRPRPDRGASRRDSSVLDSASDLPELRPGAAGNVPVLPVLRRRGGGGCRRPAPRGAQGRHRPLRRPRRLHRARRDARPGGRPRRCSRPTTRSFASELERFGGTVEKFIGDAVMALFGAPVAHEDDPERAVRAALAIRDWAGEQGDELQVRIAVNTGEALVALDARPSEGEGMAAGDVVNTAARLQAAAPVNGVLVGEQTYRATAQAIDYREAEPVVGKGKSEPVPAWEALEARSRFGVDVSRRADAPLVGRGRELELLVSTLARVREERSPQLVTLVGVPGIGKSRLVHELFERVERGRRARPLAAGPLASLRRGRHLLGARRDRQGARRASSRATRPSRPRRSSAARSASSAPTQRSAQWLERHLRPLAGLAGGRLGRRRGGRRGLAPLPRGAGRGAAARARVRGSALGRRRAARLRRPARRAGERRPAARRSAPRAPSCCSGGRAGAAASRTPSRSRSRRSPTRTPRGSSARCSSGRCSTRETQEALLARAGGNPLYAEQYARILLERGDLRSCPRRCRASSPPGSTRSPRRRSGCCRTRPWSARSSGWAPSRRSTASTRGQAEELLHALERKEFVQRARALVGRRRERVRLPPPADPRRRLRPDPAGGPLATSTGARPPGSSRSAAPRIRPRCSPTTTWRRSSSRRRPGSTRPALGESARHALRDAGDRAAALYAVDAAERFYDAALRLWPEDDPERGRCSFAAPHPWSSGCGGDPGRLKRHETPCLPRATTRGRRGRDAARRGLLDAGPGASLFDEHARPGGCADRRRSRRAVRRSRSSCAWQRERIDRRTASPWRSS